MSITEKLTIFKDPSKQDFYIASYSGDDQGDAFHLAHKGTLADAIREALMVWGLNEEEVYIEASN
jgi:hypothetical protein